MTSYKKLTPNYYYLKKKKIHILLKISFKDLGDPQSNLDIVI